VNVYPQGSVAIDTAEAFDGKRLRRRLRVACWLLAAMCGALQAWNYRYDIKDLDGISYLDVGDAYFRGDWGTAINGYWSPLYSWLLGLAVLALRPSPRWEYSAVQLVNLAVYLCAIGCFEFFLRAVIRYHRGRPTPAPSGGPASLPEWAWLALGYPLFVWSSLFWIYRWMQCPDMCVAAFVYLAAGLLLRIRAGATGWLPFAALGAVLGFGYLAKTAMFPLAFVFLLVAMLSAGSLRRAVRGVLIALAAFLLVGGPFLVALSKTKGRVTFGDVGKIAYAWYINQTGVRHWPHWQGESAGGGTPKHPARKLLEGPTIYEFATPVGGTYPVWYDPSYWCEGMTVSFDLRQQAEYSLLGSARFYSDFFVFSPQCALIVGLLTLCLMSGGGRPCVKGLLRQWGLLVPALAAMAMYGLVHLETRYVGPFVLLFWFGCFSGVRLPDRRGSRRPMGAVIVAMAVVMALAIGISTARELRWGAGASSPDASAVAHWQVAEGLRQRGLRPGDKVAVIGSGMEASRWARLARVQIIAELPWQEQDRFWAADEPVKSRVIGAFAKLGVRVVVAREEPGGAPMTGWQRIGDADWYAYFLPGPER
jgi:hypothetical protein